MYMKLHQQQFADLQFPCECSTNFKKRKTVENAINVSYSFTYAKEISMEDLIYDAKR